MSGTTAQPLGITDPPIDDLMEKTDSKYALVIFAARRARQINAYYSQLGEGLLEYVGPLVETDVQEKPLSIALREVAADKLTFEEADGELEHATGLPQGTSEAAALALSQQYAEGGDAFGADFRQPYEG